MRPHQSIPFILPRGKSRDSQSTFFRSIRCSTGGPEVTSRPPSRVWFKEGSPLIGRSSGVVGRETVLLLLRLMDVCVVVILCLRLGWYRSGDFKKKSSFR
ncbi:hypothetical protein NPIL_420971 [Nephila pilipes]|uniref:Transmembrane protein n=1 Tax=Nephila pilipes TaxID=299642 RepID=A0A8X6QGJ2_NEPPI|nr:hypothetical protein NPIL_420971 [Nephila pilipes]